MKWKTHPPISPPQELSAFVGGHPLITETLYRRGFQTIDTINQFLNPENYPASSPYELPDMNKAIDVLLDALEKKERIGIWGDFDVDGQTSTTLLVSALRKIGADVIFYIPIRGKESHGISEKPLQAMIDKGMQLLITCDTGVKEHELIEKTMRQGCRVIITDHHDLPEKLPAANAVINSECVPSNHPLHTLPGVGVAFKLIEALYEALSTQESLEDLLDLVALGIVVDVAIQTGDTRYLLQKGLKKLRNTNRLGLNAIFELARIHKPALNEVDIGFQIGPRLNSLGRLGDTNTIVDFLITDDSDKADLFANDLERINATRKHHKEQILAGALNQIESHPEYLDFPVIVVAQEGWNGGIVGLVASSLSEKYERPAIVLSTNTERGIASGSARSIPQINISQAITACSDLLDGFGGHPMAAGMRMPLENVDEFRKRIGNYVETTTKDISLEQELLIDYTLPLTDLTQEFVEDMERLSPFGQGNPALIFRTNNLKIIRNLRIGKNKEHLKLLLEDVYGNTQEVFFWFGANQLLPKNDAEFDLAYILALSYFNNKLSVQVTWKDAKTSEIQSTLLSKKKKELEILDFRAIENPQIHLSKILTNYPEAVIWAEAEQKNISENTKDRTQITEAETLVLWTSPSDRMTLLEVLQIAQPNRIICYQNTPQAITLKEFIRRLGGLLKHNLLNQNGMITIKKLAAATAQPSAAIHYGLLWYQSKNIFNLIATQDGFMIEHTNQNSLLNNQNQQMPQQIAKDINQILEETFKFRSYYQSATLEKLLTYYE